MTLVLAADIHLDHNPDHEYRWAIFGNLRQHLGRENVEAVVIAGDLVDRKDRHPAAFVNRVVREIRDLGRVGRVVLVMGNHDYIDKAAPFFGFLGELPGVEYVREPRDVWFGERRVLCIPHGVSWNVQSHWRRMYSLAGPDGDRGRPWDLIITHETFRGAMASTTQELDGVSLAVVSKDATRGALVVSGDIHVGQRLGNVQYIGSPHHVRFGDAFERRLLLWDFTTSRVARIRVGGLRRVTAEYRRVNGELVTQAEFGVGDHVKVRFRGGVEDRVLWAEIAQALRLAVTEARAVFFGDEFILEEDASVEGDVEDDVDDLELLREYGRRKGLDDAIVAAMEGWM